MLYLIDTGKGYLESVSDEIISVVEASPSLFGLCCIYLVCGGMYFRLR